MKLVNRKIANAFGEGFGEATLRVEHSQDTKGKLSRVFTTYADEPIVVRMDSIAVPETMMPLISSMRLDVQAICAEHPKWVAPTFVKG